MDGIAIARALLASVVIAFLPGYAWLRVAAPEVTGVARLALSIVLSVAMVVLGLYLGSYLVGARVGGVQAILVALALTLAALAYRLRGTLPDRLARIS